MRNQRHLTVQLICAFVFAYLIYRFYHDAAKWLIYHVRNKIYVDMSNDFQFCNTIRVLTHQKNAAFFCMLFIEVLPFTTLAVSVNSKTSKACQNDAALFGVSRPSCCKRYTMLIQSHKFRLLTISLRHCLDI